MFTCASASAMILADSAGEYSIMIYQPVVQPRSIHVELRGLQIHVNAWGPDDGSLVFMLHGWGDCGACFQFLVDAMDRHWRVLAPDWRGFGRSGRSPGGYWFPDYLADLEVLADHFSPGSPIRVVGHSMGANVACLFGGVRPERVSHLVNMEGLGLPDTESDLAPDRYARWLDELREFPSTGSASYDSLEALAGRVRSRNPLISTERALFVASCWAVQAEDGQLRLRMDPRHRHLNPVLYRRPEARACWRRITAKLLMLLGQQTDILSRPGTDDLDLPSDHVASARVIRIADAAHMLHIERPEAVAGAIQGFLN